MAEAAVLDAPVRAPLQSFFARLARISADSPPPAPNAANDFWRKNTKEDAGLHAPLQAPAGSSEDVVKAYTLYAAFQTDLLAAFNHDAAHSDEFKNPGILLPALKDLAGDILKVAEDIWNIYQGGAAARVAAIASLKKDLETLIDKINKQDNLTHGENANGFVSVDAHKAAENALAALGAIPPGTTTDAGRLADVLRTVCTQLKSLSTEHSPWLRADWQVSYQGIMQAAAAGLNA